MGWMDVNGWACEGGAFLVTKRIPEDIDYREVALALKKLSLDCLVIVGGWEGYTTALKLKQLHKELPFLEEISIMLIPARYLV